jgi:ABC-type phosphate/phosphonate transport system ATPase subunit
MLVIEGLSRRYPGRLAVGDVLVAVRRGEFVGVTGRPGAGKSTLLRMINRLVEPSDGRILWNGGDVTALRGRALREWRARCAMVFQQFNLVGRLRASGCSCTGWRRLWPSPSSTRCSPRRSPSRSASWRRATRR